MQAFIAEIRAGSFLNTMSSSLSYLLIRFTSSELQKLIIQSHPVILTNMIMPNTVINRHRDKQKAGYERYNAYLEEKENEQRRDERPMRRNYDYLSEDRERVGLREIQGNRIEEPEISKVIGEILENQKRLEREISILRIQNHIKGQRSAHFASVVEEKKVQKPENEEKKTESKVKSVESTGNVTRYRTESVLKFLKQGQSQTSCTSVNQKPLNFKDQPQKQPKFILRPQNERLIVSQTQKQQFWKVFASRFQKCKPEPDKSIQHPNKKYEQDHLTNTNQLQARLKQQVMGKIYSQCNNCVYK